MTNRCPDCNKFVSLETQEPEEESLEISGTEVEASYRVVRACMECSTEMKEATIDGTVDIPDEFLADHPDDPDGEHGGYEVEAESVEATESGGGRYAKNMIGFSATVKVTCKCGASTDGLIVEGEEAASFFDEV